ncbi:MAG TPA: haloacid dehalogenase-like hydrolase [Ilumatobacter sp.]|nr:haloacid dehalogenase-like hydrolase [Ilumatobacter sp.]
MGGIVLWDIDGTLLRSRAIGVQAFTRAVERATGAVWTPRRLDFGGRTDPEIATLIMNDAGVADASLVPAVLEALVVAYDELADDLRAAVEVLPGVAAALAELAALDAIQTVVTGNLRPVAEAKLGAAGIADRLEVDLGGYGSDHRERAELVRLALGRVAAGVGRTHDAREVWVVGDTPRDLACARDNGVRCALIATGTYDVDQLSGLGADLVLTDLHEVDQLLTAISG